MASAAPIRIGVIGCGNVLSAYRATLARLRDSGAAVAAMACGRPAQEEEARRALGPVEFVTEAQKVIRSPNVDVVLILTSMSQHAPLAIAAMEGGKHVVLEKPLATNLTEADAVLAAAQRTGRKLVCAPFTTLSPTFQIMARRLREGDIGKPCLARARYGWAGPWWSEWFYKPGGGCLFDLGVYCVTTLTGLLGPARRVTAMAGVAIPEREINGRMVRVEAEDNAQVLIDFGGSTFATVTTGFTMQQYRSPAVEIFGTTGALQMLGDDWDPEGYELWQNSAGCWQVFKETHPDWSWTDGLTHLVECLREGREPVVAPDHARHVLEVLLKAQEAARDGQSRAIESSFAPLNFGEPVSSSEAAHLVHDRTREHTP